MRTFGPNNSPPIINPATSQEGIYKMPDFNKHLQPVTEKAAVKLNSGAQSHFKSALGELNRQNLDEDIVKEE